MDVKEEKLLVSISTRAMQTAGKLINDKGVGSEEWLPFHCVGHTVGVQRRAAVIADAMRLGSRHKLLVQIAAAFHDTVQVSVRTSGGDGIRRLFAGYNETASALEAIKFMNEKCSDAAFHPDEMGIVATAILTTIPAWSAAHATAIQPLLTSASSPVARAVALADLGEAGMEPLQFVEGGSKLFAEDQIGLMESFIFRGGRHSSTTVEKCRLELIRWLKTQPPFARGRQALLAQELEGLDDEARKSVAALFCRFDESIKLAEEAVGRAEQMDGSLLVDQLLLDAFPTIPL